MVILWGWVFHMSEVSLYVTGVPRHTCVGAGDVTRGEEAILYEKRIE
jgi:hypothetical protein